MGLLEKEKALKLKECELAQKEILLSSKRSLTSTTDSRASISPRHSHPSMLTLESMDSNHQTSSIPENGQIILRSEHKEEEQIINNDDSRCCNFQKFNLERNDSKESADSADIVNDARAFLMKKINVNDLT